MAAVADIGAPDEAFAPEFEIPPEPGWRIAVAGLAGVLAAGWIGTIAWLATGQDLRDPLRLLSFVVAGCAVPVLLGIGYLVAARASGSHAARLAANARALRFETEALQRTTTGLAERMAASRDALASQVRALTALGDSAGTRLDGIGRELAASVAESDSHVRALNQAVDATDGRLRSLLASVRKSQDEVQALSGALTEIGHAARDRTAGLEAQLVALAQRGREADAIAEGSAEKLAAHITRMDASSEAAAAKLDTAARATADEVDALLGRTADAMEESRRSIGAQADAMLAMVRANQAALDSAARESAEALAQRIEIVELVIDRVASRLEAQRQSGDAMVRDLEIWIDRAEHRLDRLRSEGEQRTAAIARSLDGLSVSADAATQAIASGNTAAVTAISSAETLLIALDSAAREMDETLMGSLARLDSRVDGSRARLGTIKPDLLALVAASQSTNDVVEAVAAALAEQRRDAEAVGRTLTAGLIEGTDKASALRGEVGAIRDEIDTLAEVAASRLVEALLRVRDTATAAADQARDTLAEVIPEAAQAIEAEAAAALGRAAGRGLEAQIGQMASAADNAVNAASRAAARLETQLARVGESTAALDVKLEAAEADERDTFSRRASALIDALNAASIDLARSLSQDIGDPAWAAYMKGDRGIFTRQAVRLLGGNEAGEIARLYSAESDFKDAVNRYIRDFEAMLRVVLAQRDGSPLGVTLLSSDVGKLYVALAQAIERLR